MQTLLFGAQQVEVTVVGRVTSSAAELLVGGAGLVADNEAIAQWQPTDTPSGEVRSAAAHVKTLRDDYFASRNKCFLLLTAFAVVVAIVAAPTIDSAMSVITGSRVRETKLVRAIGGSSMDILAAAVVETTVLGLLGVALGLPLWVALAGATPAVTEELGIRVPLYNVGLPASWLAAIGAVALAVTVLSALPAAVLSVRRSAVESAEASESRALQARYVVVAFVFAGAAFALRGGGVIRAVAAAGLATLSAAALSVIIPLLLRVRVPLPRLGLALGYASRQWNRSASVIGIVTVAVALVAAVLTGSEHLRSHFVDATGKEGLVGATVTSLTGDIDPACTPIEAAKSLSHLVCAPRRQVESTPLRMAPS